MLGISSTYTVNLFFLDYSPKTRVMRFKVRTQPAINGLMRGLLQKRIQKKYPFMKLNGETIEIISGQRGVAADGLDTIQIYHLQVRRP